MTEIDKAFVEKSWRILYVTELNGTFAVDTHPMTFNEMMKRLEFYNVGNPDKAYWIS